MNGKRQKGEFGYRKAHRKRQMGVVGFFLAAIAALLIWRQFITWDGLRNLVTISAILLVLPMANLASPFVAALKIQETSEALHSACMPYEGKFPILYDLIVTSAEQIIPIDAAVIHPSGVYCYCPDKKLDGKKAEHFLNEMLVKWKLDGNAKVMNEEKSFLRRLSQLKEVSEAEADGSAPHVAKLLKSLSM